MKRASAALLACSMGLAMPAFAQDGVGFNFAELEFGLGASKSVGVEPILDPHMTNLHLSGRGVVDFSLSPTFGVQGDLGINDYDMGTLASLEAHGYYTPDDTMKFGVFLGYGMLDEGGVLGLVDAAGLSADPSYTMGGIEGMFALGEKARVEGSLGIGKAEIFGLDSDFKTASLGLDYDFTPTGTGFATASLTDVDELDSKIWAVDVGYKYALPDAPVTLSASVGVTGAEGELGDYMETEPRVKLGAVWHFGGRASGNSVHDKAFRSHAPFDPALQRLEF